MTDFFLPTSEDWDQNSVFKIIGGDYEGKIFKNDKKVFSTKIEFALLNKNSKPIKYPDNIKSKIKNLI